MYETSKYMFSQYNWKEFVFKLAYSNSGEIVMLKVAAKTESNWSGYLQKNTCFEAA